MKIDVVTWAYHSECVPHPNRQQIRRLICLNSRVNLITDKLSDKRSGWSKVGRNYLFATEGDLAIRWLYDAFPSINRTLTGVMDYRIS